MLILLAGNALALEINFGDRSYPGYLFIPLLFIAIIWIVILLMWSFRHFKALSLFFFNVGRFVAQFGIGAGIRKLKEKISERGKKEGEAETVKKAEIKEEEAKRDLTGFAAKVDALEKKIEKSKDADEMLKEFGPMVKDFLAALLNIHYEFTDAEIVEVLEKKKKHLVDFAQKISDMKFSGKKVSRKELEAGVKEFKSIVHKYVETGWKPKRVAKGVIERLAEQDKRILTNVRQYVDFLKHENRKKQIESLLSDEQEILKRNIRSMKQTYNRVLKMYVQLTPNDKAVVYPQLVEFYNNANKAIFSSVYGKKSRKELEYFVKELKRLKEMPKREPWLLRMKHKISMPKAPEVKAPAAKIKAPKAPAVKVKARKELLSLKPLFVKLVKVFRPSHISEKKAKRMFKPKKKAEKARLKEPTLKPLLEKISRIRDIGESFRASFRKRFGRKIPTTAEKLIVPLPEGGAIEELGRLLEGPTIQRVDYAAKLRQKMSEGWNLIALSDFRKFDELYDRIKIDYVNLGKEEQAVLGPKIIILHDASIKARVQKERQAIEEQGRKAEELLKQGIEAKEKVKAQAEARKILDVIESELKEEEELREEEEELLRLEAERKQKEAEALRQREQRKLRADLKQVDRLFREKARLEKEQEERRVREEYKAYKLAEEKKKKKAAELERLLQAKEKADKAQEEIRLKEDYGAYRLEQERRRREQAEAKKAAAEIDRIFREKEAREAAELARIKKREEEEAARLKEKKEAEERLRRQIQVELEREAAARQREAWLLKREEERRKKELDRRRKEAEKFRSDKEREWKEAIHEKSLSALESLEDELRRRIREMGRRPVSGESMKERVAREAEIVRQEAEAKRAAEQKKRKLVEKKKKKKEDVVSPLEQEQLKLLLELERMKEGL